MHARLRQQLAAVDRAVDAEQDGELDRAGRVEPAVGVIVELGPRLEVGDGDGERARALDLLLELGESLAQLACGAQRRDPRWLGGRVCMASSAVAMRGPLRMAGAG